MTDQGPVITLSADAWEAFLATLFERDDRLDVREAGVTYAPDEKVDAWTLSAHAEALRSGEVDGDVWGTLQDIEETAGSEEDAWAKIVAFYLERDCVLVQVQGYDEPEEWLLSEALARRLALPGLRG
ncbi:hypothetical protein LAJ19_04095 [Deinococcus taeanensis]|uniref:hypothetical protein n=1 Tax=Deinococcus taeanensis TaxID=2737050 RepID=UPI001CDB98E6|nr:hypothetical protein [Deinococcus taeanensis]UBV43403.1 hypothetical protein LAJ19_04095 [Deinococcus taeanensis]